MGWKPRDPEAPDAFATWQPFLLAAREMRLENLPWMLDPLDFRFIGQVERSGRKPLSVYVHVRTGGKLAVDPSGLPFRVTLDRALRIRTKPIDLSHALWGTGVPNEELEREPRHNGRHPRSEECEACRRHFDEEEEAWRAQQEEARRAQRARKARQLAAAAGVPSSDGDTSAGTARHLRVVR